MDNGSFSFLCGYLMHVITQDRKYAKNFIVVGVKLGKLGMEWNSQHSSVHAPLIPGSCCVTGCWYCSTEIDFEMLESC